MWAEFHFLRPGWLLALIPLALIWGLGLHKNSVKTAWQGVCDAHLLPYLLEETHAYKKRTGRHFFLLLSGFWIIIGLSGPTWSKIAVPTFQKIQPRVFILDLSESMLVNDLSPDRLSRTKFILQDLLQPDSAGGTGQLGLVVYAGEPFVASPLTEDGKTIEALLPALLPEIMPVPGQRLDTALEEGAKLLHQAGFNTGELLVLTGTPPTEQAIQAAALLKKSGVYTSIMPVMSSDQVVSKHFSQLANAGGGSVLAFGDPVMLEAWLKKTKLNSQFNKNSIDEIPLWHDEGRWFIIPALLFLLPVFRRGWLQEIGG